MTLRRTNIRRDTPGARRFADTRRAPLRRTGFGKRGDSRNLRHTPLRVVVSGEEVNWNVAAKGEYECRNCGAPAVHLHHAIPRSRSQRGKRDLRNGIGLCKSCHDYWHAGGPIYRDVFTAEEWAFICELENGLVGWLGRRYPVRPSMEEAA